MPQTWPAKKRISRTLLYVFTGFLLSAFLALALAFFYLRHNAVAIAQACVDKLTYGSGVSVEMKRVEAVFWPEPALVVGGLALEADGWHFTLEELKLRPDFPAMLRGVFLPRVLELEHPALRCDRPETPAALGAFFAAAGPGENGENTWMEDLRLTVKNGEVLIGESGGISPLLDSLNMRVDAGKANGGAGLCAIRSSGRVYRDGVALPFDLNGTGFVYGREKQTFFPPHRVVARNVAVRLDNDLAELDVELTLPVEVGASSGPTPEDGPRVTVVPVAQPGRDAGADRQAVTDGETLFKIKGELRIQRVSLPRWLGFGRVIPPGLQLALGNVTDAALDFSLDEKGLDVPRIAACASGACFTGTGMVKSWAEPRLTLDLRTERLNLLSALPEAAGSMPQAPEYTNPPLTPVPGAPLLPGETGLNYDIRLGAALLDYGPLLLENAQVVIHEGKLDENGLEDMLLTATAGLYGGSVQAQAIFGGGAQHPYAITARIRDVNGGELANALDVVPVQSGRMRVDVNIRSQGRALAEFLEKLSGKVDVSVGQGALRRLPSSGNVVAGSAEKKPERSALMQFDSLTLGLGVSSATFDNEKERLGLSGQWSSVLNASGYSLRTDISGMVYFGGGRALSFQNRPGTLALQTTAVKEQEPLAELKGNFSCASDKGMLAVNQGRLSAPGLEASGDMQVVEDGAGLTYKGAISAHSRDAPRLAALTGAGSVRFLNSLRSFSLAAEVKGTKQEITLGNLRADVNGVPVRGSLSAVFRKQPSFDFKLSVEEFSTDHFGQGNGTKAKQADKAWDLRALRDIRAKGALHVGRLKLWHFLLQDVNIPVRLDNGRLISETMTAQVYGGALSAKSTLEFTQGLHFDSKFLVDGADLAAASSDISQTVRLDGKMGFSLSLSGLLTGLGSMTSPLDGSWQFLVRNGSYRKVDKNGETKGKPTLFDAAQASGEIKAGVARSDNFDLRGRDIGINGGGSVNLNDSSLDCNFLINMKNMPDIPVRLHGNFKDSKTTVSVGKVILNTLEGIPKGIFDILGDIVQGAWKLIR